ncbi:MAG: heavy-metal-associated domain-containing protein [Spirochaetota bacterium]
MMQYTFNVPDMTCNHCKMRIEKAVSSLNHLESVNIDLDKKLVIVEGDAPEKDIRQAIEDSGYPVSKA